MDAKNKLITLRAIMAKQQPVDLTEIRRYEHKRYRGLDQRLVHGLESHIINRFLDEVYAVNDVVLDVPSGYGRFTETLLDRPLNVYVADLNIKMLLRVNERFGREPRYINASLFHLPFGDHTFHGLLSMRLIQHFHTPEDRIEAFAEIRRVISDWAVISVYTSTGLHRLFRVFRDHHKITMADKSQLNHELDKAGLTIVKSRKILPGFHAQTILLVQPKESSR